MDNYAYDHGIDLPVTVTEQQLTDAILGQPCGYLWAPTTGELDHAVTNPRFAVLHCPDDWPTQPWRIYLRASKAYRQRWKTDHPGNIVGTPYDRAMAVYERQCRSNGMVLTTLSLLAVAAVATLCWYVLRYGF